MQLSLQALGGSAASVEVLLAKGADPGARRADGKTPADLAEAVGWAQGAARQAEGEERRREAAEAVTLTANPNPNP